MPGQVNVALRWARAGSAPTITSPAFLVAGTVNSVYPTTTFTASGTAPITWSYTGTLPAGMAFSSGGVLAGTPTATSSGSLTFTATNAFGSDSRTLTLTVNAAGASAPINYAIPELKGAPQVGSTLTVANDPGSWLNSPTSNSSKWQVSTIGTGSWSDIAGQTGSSYTIVSGDVGKYIRRLTTATNASGPTDIGSSAWGPIVASTTVPLLKSDSVTYLGSYNINSLVGSSIIYVYGIAIRRVSGDPRLIIQTYDGSVSNKNVGQFWELSLSGKSYGDNITTPTRKWAVGAVDSYGGTLAAAGRAYLNWDETNSKLLLSQAVDYNASSTVIPNVLQSFTLTDGTPVGTTSDLKAVTIGTIPDRRAYNGVTPIPAALQSDWGVGPYAVGFGGYTSTQAQGGEAAIGLSMYAIPDYSTYANGSTILDANIKALAARGNTPIGRSNYYGFSFVPDGGSTPAFSGYPSGVPTGTFNGLGVIQFLNGGDYRQNPPENSPPNFMPLPGNEDIQSPDSYNWGRWGWTGFMTGAFINGTNQRAFCAMYSTATGKSWYGASAGRSDGSISELHLFNPDQIKEIVNGTRAATNIEPYATLPLYETSAIAGGRYIAGIDTVGNRIYVLRQQNDLVGRDFGRLFVYQINNV